MQTQLARLALASRACNDLAACMPSMSVYPRMLSSLPFPLSDALRPTDVVAGLRESLSAVQPFSYLPMPHLTPLTDRNIHPPAFVPVRAAYTPLTPAQLQAAVRVAQVQQLASMCLSIPELEGELPSAVKGFCGSHVSQQNNLLCRWTTCRAY